MMNSAGRVSGNRESTKRVTAYCLLPTPRFRSGVSLLEVLISIFVILFGLLGVAAVLPLGSRNMAEIAKSDNASACGTSALRSVRTWGILNPYSWRWPDFSGKDPTASTPTYASLPYPTNPSPQGAGRFLTQQTGGYYLPYLYSSIAIDPYFVARAARTFSPAGNNNTDPRPQFFPYDPATQSRTGYTTLCMPRVTLGLPNDPSTLNPTVVAQGAMAESNWAQHAAFFSRFFIWPDDPTIPLLTGVTDSERPRQMFLCSDGANRVRPNLTTDTSTAVPSMAQIQGDYTWMAIVTPSFNETGAWDSTNNLDTSLTAKQRTQYLVQIVVFDKRDVTVPRDYLTTDEAPAERSVVANILSGGYGGGDVSLTTRVADGNYSHYLTVRKNQWIMLAGQTTRGYVFRWYRVVSPGEPPAVVGTDWVRYVTLAGPDWNPAWCQSGTQAVAVIADGVIGVYTMTFDVDRDLQVSIQSQ